MENVIIRGAGEPSPVSWTPRSIQFESGDSDPGAGRGLRVHGFTSTQCFCSTGRFGNPGLVYLPQSKQGSPLWLTVTE